VINGWKSERRLGRRKKRQPPFVPKIRQYEKSRIGNSVLVTHSRHDSSRRS